jgi:hypothetical protein
VTPIEFQILEKNGASLPSHVVGSVRGQALVAHVKRCTDLVGMCRELTWEVMRLHILYLFPVFRLHNNIYIYVYIYIYIHTMITIYNYH